MTTKRRRFSALVVCCVAYALCAVSSADVYTWDFTDADGVTLYSEYTLEVDEASGELRTLPYMATADANTVLLLRLNEDTGQIAYDSSGNNHNGYAANVIWGNGGVFGDNSVGMSGSGYIAVPETASFDLEYEITASLWVKLNSNAGGTRYLLSKWNETTEEEAWRLYLLGNVLYADVNTAGGVLSVSASASFTIGEWVQAGFTYSATDDSFALYVNGSEVSSCTNGNELITDATANIYVGGQGAWSGIYGLIDEVFISSVVETSMYAYDGTPATAYASITSASSVAATTITDVTFTYGVGNEGEYEYQVLRYGTPYWYTAGAWTRATAAANRNSATDVDTNIGTLIADIGYGSFGFRMFAISDGGREYCALDSIALRYGTTAVPTPTAPWGQLICDQIANCTFSGMDADTVDGFHASLTPQPSTILPLNAAGDLAMATNSLYAATAQFSEGFVDIDGSMGSRLSLHDDDAYLAHYAGQTTLKSDGNIEMRVYNTGVLGYDGKLTVTEMVTSTKLMEIEGATGDLFVHGGMSLGYNGVDPASGELYAKTVTSASASITEASISGNISCDTIKADTYVGLPSSVAGSDTYIQFNDGGVLGADSSMTFVKGTNTFQIGVGGEALGSKFIMYDGHGAYHTDITQNTSTFNIQPLQSAAYVVINDDGAAPVDFRVEGLTSTHLLYTDGEKSVVAIRSSDVDGTPATGELIIKGRSADGSTNILMLRDSSETNVFSVDTDGGISGVIASDYSASLAGTVIARAVGDATIYLEATHSMNDIDGIIVKTLIKPSSGTHSGYWTDGSGAIDWWSHDADTVRAVYRNDVTSATVEAKLIVLKARE